MHVYYNNWREMYAAAAKERDELKRMLEGVVHCKECVYWQDNNGGYPHEECRWSNDETPDPDDFCSFGERRKDG